jgi:hypothetical protein
MERRNDYEVGGTWRENCERKKEENEKIRNNLGFTKTEVSTSMSVTIVFWYETPCSLV